jgi:hypothetical protein
LQKREGPKIEKASRRQRKLIAKAELDAATGADCQTDSIDGVYSCKEALNF